MVRWTWDEKLGQGDTCAFKPFLFIITLSYFVLFDAPPSFYLSKCNNSLK